MMSYLLASLFLSHPLSVLFPAVGEEEELVEFDLEVDEEDVITVKSEDDETS